MVYFPYILVFKLRNVGCVGVGAVNWECGSSNELCFLGSEEGGQASDFGNFPNASEWDGRTTPVQVLQDRIVHQ